MYGIGGERWLPEQTLDWLPGYEGSAPVRIGNAAADQFQLDIFGEGMDAVHYRWSIDGGMDSPEFFLAGSCPFSGISRAAGTTRTRGYGRCEGLRRHFTYSRVMAWVAFDRAIRCNGAAGR